MFFFHFNFVRRMRVAWIEWCNYHVSFFPRLHSFSSLSLSLALMTRCCRYFFAVVFRWIKRFLENVFVMQKWCQWGTNETGTISLHIHKYDTDLMHYRYYITASHQFFSLYIDKCVSDLSFVSMPTATNRKHGHQSGYYFSFSLIFAHDYGNRFFPLSLY